MPRQHFETLLGVIPGLTIVRVEPFRRPLGTFPPQLFRHRDIVTAKQNIESTYVLYFPEEHDSGSPEELCFLVPAFVQQFRKIPLQGRENNLQCDRHGGKPIRAIRWSGQGAVAQ